jgi:hypothetical protein
LSLAQGWTDRDIGKPRNRPLYPCGCENRYGEEGESVYESPINPDTEAAIFRVVDLAMRRVELNHEPP